MCGRSAMSRSGWSLLHEMGGTSDQYPGTWSCMTLRKVQLIQVTVLPINSTKIF